eukprot:CAMPEP_0170517734 /NCGR_PEP_ID=MMETSP0209-20121228/3622_1 /TAXON_ID=665100 ORGANISM="Litonotus pictus, Strain P1" /NCGR_SAMPLE_ID=MMETSP0209 /ASSEMBLY_ACC=CAM_ASM_000301 /LENGTH=148 /DNA_ID=CAMNT_0010803061 /DNA_START=270 /DNA_END=716 /DNA_ORIENTATION=+
MKLFLYYMAKKAKETPRNNHIDCITSDVKTESQDNKHLPNVLSEDPMCNSSKIKNNEESPQEEIDEINYIRSNYNNSNNPKVIKENKGISNNIYSNQRSNIGSSNACYTKDKENPNSLIAPMKSSSEDREDFTLSSLNSKKEEKDKDA